MNLIGSSGGGIERRGMTVSCFAYTTLPSVKLPCIVYLNADMMESKYIHLFEF